MKINLNMFCFSTIQFVKYTHQHFLIAKLSVAFHSALWKTAKNDMHHKLKNIYRGKP